MGRITYALNTTDEEHAAVAATSHEHPQVADDSSSEWLTDEICQQILHMLQSLEDDDRRKFRPLNRKKLYKGGKVDQPNFSSSIRVHTPN